MCVQCVAQSVPYAVAAIGGLRLASWNSRRSRRAAVDGPDDVTAGTLTPAPPTASPPERRG